MVIKGNYYTMNKINQLIDFLQKNKDVVKPNELKGFLQQLNITTKELIPWADFNHPKNDGYGRKLVHENSNFEIMIMSWLPNDFSAVHNHGLTQWGAVQVFGNASHYIYQLNKKNSIKLIEKESLNSGDILLVTNEFIHQMGNQTTKPYLSLHIYGTIVPQEIITKDSLIYEIEKKRIVKTTGGAFFQLSESKVEMFSELSCVDEKTLIEFSTTILPKSITFSKQSKQSITTWLKNVL